MAADTSSNKFLLITLIVAVGVLSYYYYDASSVATSLYNDADKLRHYWAASNKTIADLRLELEGCKAQLKVLEDEKNKARADLEAKDKQVKEKSDAEKTATDELAKVKKEKEELDKKANEAKTQFETCTKECDDKVKKAKEECSKAGAPAAAAVPPAQPATS